MLSKEELIRLLREPPAKLSGRNAEVTAEKILRSSRDGQHYITTPCFEVHYQKDYAGKSVPKHRGVIEFPGAFLIKGDPELDKLVKFNMHFNQEVLKEIVQA